MDFYIFHIISLSFIFSIFLFGLLGFFQAGHNLILILLSCEIILLGVILGVAFCAVFFNDMLLEFFILILLVLGGAEAVIALAIIIIFYRMGGALGLSIINNLKG